MVNEIETIVAFVRLANFLISKHVRNSLWMKAQKSEEGLWGCMALVHLNPKADLSMEVDNVFASFAVVVVAAVEGPTRTNNSQCKKANMDLKLGVKLFEALLVFPF